MEENNKENCVLIIREIIRGIHTGHTPQDLAQCFKGMSLNFEWECEFLLELGCIQQCPIGVCPFCDDYLQTNASQSELFITSPVEKFTFGDKQVSPSEIW